MRTTVFLQLVLLVTTAWAGGYQGCVERLLLFYAYQIDELNDAADRTLGFRCKKWDSAKKECMPTLKDPAKPDDPPVPEWEECVGKVLPSKRCTFNELNGSLGKLRSTEKLVGGNDADGKPLPQDTKTPDITETAKNVYNKFMAQPKPVVHSYPPYKFLKEAKDEYNDFLNRVSDVVIKAAPSKRNKDTQFLFDGFQNSLDAIKDARVGDHGPFLIADAEPKLKAQGIEVVKMKVGSGKNPVTGEVWETVDWENTIATAVAKGKERDKVLSAISEWDAGFYKPGSEAFKHKVVIESYKKMEDGLLSC
ncbi:hypothetical protein V8C35DRAFT_295938 [Trichoderma chlorosporum]